MLWNIKINFIKPNYNDYSWKALLRKVGLKPEKNLDITLLVKEQNKLVATGSLDGNIIKCLAVDPNYQKQGLMSIVISRLKAFLIRRERKNYFVYAHRNQVPLLENLGFNELVGVGKYPVLLEDGISKIEDYINIINSKITSFNAKKKYEQGKIASLVMNCNPVTKGHSYLIEKASRNNQLVIIFILSEDKSLFSAKERRNLLQKVVAGKDNVIVVPSGNYILSYSTFPKYFLSEDQEKESIRLYAQLDAHLFGKYFARSLGIKRRYVGTEPNSVVTAIYNQQLKNILPQYGVDLIEIQRIEMKGIPISASRVRKLLKEDKLDQIKSLVSRTTWDYLKFWSDQNEDK